MNQRLVSLLFAFLCAFIYSTQGAPVPTPPHPTHGYTSVQHMLGDHGFHQNHIGEGQAGTVHQLKHPFNGHNAVVKIVDKVAVPTAGNTVNEAHNAAHAGQLLGWGHDTSHGRDTHYLVMKNMGIKAEHTGLPQHKIDSLNREAEHRYEHELGIKNRDRNGGNFVYHQNNHEGKWQAEVVDWTRAEHNHGHIPGLAPENVQKPHASGRHCPSCTVQ